MENRRSELRSHLGKSKFRIAMKIAPQCSQLASIDSQVSLPASCPEDRRSAEAHLLISDGFFLKHTDFTRLQRAHVSWSMHDSGRKLTFAPECRVRQAECGISQMTFILRECADARSKSLSGNHACQLQSLYLAGWTFRQFLEEMNDVWCLKGTEPVLADFH